MKILEKLITTIRNAGKYNSDAQVAPAAILWPDKDGQWQHIIPQLQAELPELLVFGPYNPTQQTGPAIWLRYKLADSAPSLTTTSPKIPILYLPGIDLNDLQPTDECRPDLAPDVACKKGAGVLHEKRNMDWKKDRCKDVETTPWFNQFNGERIYHHHFAPTEKKTAAQNAGNTEIKA